MMSNLCLGTAQFGLDYGCTNHSGKVSSNEIDKILEKFHTSGGIFLDTAPAYGNSETLLSGYSQYFNILSKTPHVDPLAQVDQVIESFESSLENSLAALNTSHIQGLLLHQANIVNQYPDEVINWLTSVKTDGRVRELGVSVYELPDIEDWDVLGDVIDWLQIPLNLMDERAIRQPVLAQLRNKGVKIQVRSVFMQGLLLDHKSAKVVLPEPARVFLDRYNTWCEKANINKLALLFQSVMQHHPELITFGVNSISELEQILAAVGDQKANLLQQWTAQDIAVTDIPESWLNPFNWELA